MVIADIAYWSDDAIERWLKRGSRDVRDKHGDTKKHEVQLRDLKQRLRRLEASIETGLERSESLIVRINALNAGIRKHAAMLVINENATLNVEASRLKLLAMRDTAMKLKDCRELEALDGFMAKYIDSFFVVRNEDKTITLSRLTPLLSA